MPTVNSEADDLTGEHLGQCLLLERIGRGGMGQVYKARHEGLEKLVAVKVLPRGLANNDTLRKRFLNEARIAGSLEHPNIVPIYAVDEDNLHPYIVMQLVDGVPVSRLVSRQGIDPLLAAKIGIQAAQGLAYAHRKQIVHRDIKPDNLLILSNGKVKITDFGVAAALGSALAAGHSGSPPYMSPEQCRGETVDGRSDIYSLGVTLYLLLTGRRPFLGETPQAMILMHQQDDPPPLTELRPGLPMELGRIIHHMLAKAVKQRYQSASDIVDDMEDVAEVIRSLRRRTVSVRRPAVSSNESSIYRLARQAKEAAEAEEADRHETIELAILSMTTQADASVGDAQKMLKQARYEQALERVEKAIEMKPSDPRSHLLRGHIHRKMRKLKEAAEDYRRAVEIGPEDPRARSFLGSTLRMLGDLSGAREHLAYALRLNAANVEARISLGKIFEKGRAFRSAQREYEKAVELVPADERGYVALAVLHVRLKEPDKARPLLERGLEINPGFSETLYWLAVLDAPEFPERGLELLERAVKAGFRDRARLHKNPAFQRLERYPAFRNLLKVFGAEGM